MFQIQNTRSKKLKYQVVYLSIKFDHKVTPKTRTLTGDTPSQSRLVAVASHHYYLRCFDVSAISTK